MQSAVKQAQWGKALAALVALLAGAGCSPWGEAKAAGRNVRPPDVILISIDTLRADHVGCYGYERNTSPNLDRLATDSVLFERAYTTMSWTLIAHMSMLTGLYPSQHRVWTENATLASEVPTLAERLQAEGYTTLGFYDSTAHWVDPEFGFERGFERYVAHTNAEEAEQHIAEALAQRSADRPLFLFVHLFDVHNTPLASESCHIYHPPSPYDQSFVEDARERLAGINAKEWWLEDASQATQEQHEAVVALYDGGIRYVDAKIGGWLEQWRASGLYDSALILVTADHGEGLRQRAKHYGGHGDVREEGLRVPLLMKLPRGERAHTRVSTPVSHVDLLPTVLEAVGCTYDNRLSGYSLLSDRPADALVYAERDETQVLIRGNYKLVQSTKRKEIGALHDLALDPDERNPLRARSPDEASRERFRALALELQNAMAKERAGWYQPPENGVTLPAMDEELRTRMQELGYVGEDPDKPLRSEAKPEAAPAAVPGDR